MRKMFYVMCAAGVAASLAGCTKMDTAATTAAPAATEAPAKEETNAEDSECNLIVFDWISINLRIFASGWREKRKVWKRQGWQSISGR